MEKQQTVSDRPLFVRLKRLGVILTIHDIAAMIWQLIYIMHIFSTYESCWLMGTPVKSNMTFFPVYCYTGLKTTNKDEIGKQ